MEGDLVSQIEALEKKLAICRQEILEFKRKLGVATNWMSEGNSSEEDLMVLIQSIGKTSVGSRAKMLAKQWRSAKDEFNTTKQELKEMHNQLELMG
jgi:hypothetical protein